MPCRRFLPSLIAACALASCAPPPTGALPEVAFDPAAPLAEVAGPLLSHAEAEGPAGAPGKTLVAIYMLGSDLEDDVRPRNGVPDEQESGAPSMHGAGSDDLREWRAGWASLTEAERANVELLVAFGGSRKAGWKGLKIADGETVLADLENGYMGDLPAERYREMDEKAPMSERASFERFLAAAGARKREVGAARTVTILWNHGASYKGLGPDTNLMQNLGLEEIRSAFANTGYRSDVLGFDACLMGSIEVASSLRGAADYMVASPELEPGHGWDYARLARLFAQGSAKGWPELTRGMVDLFVASPAHQRTTNKTLAVYNLARIPAVADALDALGGVFDGSLEKAYPVLLDAATGTRGYGAGGGTAPVSLDVRQWAERLGASEPAAQAPAAALVSALAGAVLYARGDRSQAKLAMSGLGVFAPHNVAAVASRDYRSETASSKAFFGFVDRFAKRGQDDREPPAIAGAAEEPGGIGFDPTDNLGLRGVHTRYVAPSAERGGDREIVLVEELPIRARQTHFVAPAYDGSAMTVRTAGGKDLVVPIYSQAILSSELTLYIADVKIDDQLCLLNLYLDPEKRVTRVHAVPVLAREGLSYNLGRDQIELKAGDRIAALGLYYPANGGERYEAWSEPVVLPGPEALAWRHVASSGAAMPFAADLADNLSPPGAWFEFTGL